KHSHCDGCASTAHDPPAFERGPLAEPAPTAAAQHLHPPAMVLLQVQY
ncbi:hypothetical protein BN1723_019676, partial [Verticillium longisporum]